MVEQKDEYNQLTLCLDGPESEHILLDPRWSNMDILEQIPRRSVPALDVEFQSWYKRLAWAMDEGWASDEEIFSRKVQRLYKGFSPQTGMFLGIKGWVKGFEELLEIHVLTDLARRTHPEFLLQFYSKLYHTEAENRPHKNTPRRRRNEENRRACIDELGRRYKLLHLGHPLHWPQVQRYLAREEAKKKQ